MLISELFGFRPTLFVLDILLFPLTVCYLFKSFEDRYFANKRLGSKMLQLKMFATVNQKLTVANIFRNVCKQDIVRRTPLY